ncbi:hypothetical protein BROUX41_005781 [Berkeleyomyces rouxiae]|uniref:uncharacterized protein n=1 Tax=Berkeleyomyces rouxiae TaxID=2035830 RepID=UPI003B8199E1
MGYIGVSLIVATAVLVLVRPPPWLRRQVLLLFHGAADTVARPAPVRKTNRGAKPVIKDMPDSAPGNHHPEPNNPDQDADQTTPKATPAQPAIAVPSFSLADDGPSTKSAIDVPSLLLVNDKVSALSTVTPTATHPTNLRSSSPSSLSSAAAARRLPAFPAMNSPQRASGPTGPASNRRPGGLMAPPAARTGGASSGLAPPPSHSSVPTKPSRKVLLAPGHSPLDWARISGPNADLRGLGSVAAPYLKVTPSMLKTMTGRRGKDAWMAINGKVYNVSPYAKFHPGGVPELLRGAARDATQLFGEIHPWVNYENMLQACLVGILVEESPAAPTGSGMDDMD